MTLTCPSTCPAPNRTTVAPPSSHHCYLGLSTLCCSWLSASCLVHRFLPTWPQRMSAAISLGFFSPTWFGTTDLRSLLCTCCFSGWRVATVGPPGGCPGVTPGWQLSVVTEPLHPPLASRSGASSQMLGRPSLAVRQAAIASAALAYCIGVREVKLRIDCQMEGRKVYTDMHNTSQYSTVQTGLA